MAELTQNLLKRLIDYNPCTGVFIWRKRTEEIQQRSSQWNGRYAGKEAGYICTPIESQTKYLQIRLNYKFYQAHRLAWFYMTGEWPEHIDHDDGDGLNNRWSNLRNVSNDENQKNRPLNKNNTSGHIGVSWLKSSYKWESYIWVNRKKINLGYFEDKGDAIRVRKLAEIEYGFHKNHGRV